MAKIIKKGFVIPFNCSMCECSFVVGVNMLKSNDGNFYYNCPTCGAECHTDVARIPNEYHEAVELIVKKTKGHRHLKATITQRR